MYVLVFVNLITMKMNDRDNYMIEIEMDEEMFILMYLMEAFVFL